MLVTLFRSLGSLVVFLFQLLIYKPPTSEVVRAKRTDQNRRLFAELLGLDRFVTNRCGLARETADVTVDRKRPNLKEFLARRAPAKVTILMVAGHTQDNEATRTFTVSLTHPADQLSTEGTYSCWAVAISQKLRRLRRWIDDNNAQLGAIYVGIGNIVIVHRSSREALVDTVGAITALSGKWHKEPRTKARRSWLDQGDDTVAGESLEEFDFAGDPGEPGEGGLQIDSAWWGSDDPLPELSRPSAGAVDF